MVEDIYQGPHMSQWSIVTLGFLKFYFRSEYYIVLYLFLYQSL